MTARTETITTGASTITAATAVERSQSGMYLARVFEARYFQANTPTNTITGATMISINCVDCTMSDSSSWPIGPWGSRTPQLQPPRRRVAAKGSSLAIRLYLTFRIGRAFVHVSPWSCGSQPSFTFLMYSALGW